MCSRVSLFCWQTDKGASQTDGQIDWRVDGQTGSHSITHTAGRRRGGDKIYYLCGCIIKNNFSRRNMLSCMVIVRFTLRFLDLDWCRLKVMKCLDTEHEYRYSIASSIVRNHITLNRHWHWREVVSELLAVGVVHGLKLLGKFHVEPYIIG